MKDRPHFLLLLTAALTLSTLFFGFHPLSAQRRVKYAILLVQEESNNIGKPTFCKNAKVTLINGKDTLRPTNSESDESAYWLENIPSGTWNIHVECKGYEDYDGSWDVDFKETFASRTVSLRKIEQLSAAGVTTDAPLFKMKGDTVVFLTDNVKTEEDAAALRLLQSLPGVDINEHGVSIFGEALTKTYVDGKLVFGNDPMTALKNLPASEVESIKAYRQLNDEARRKGLENGSRIGVVDIITKHKLDKYMGASAMVSGGAEFGSGDFKYGAAASVKLFSERKSITGYADFNDINRESSAFIPFTSCSPMSMMYTATPGSRQTLGGAGLTADLQRGTELWPRAISLSYKYTSSLESTEGITIRDYTSEDRRYDTRNQSDSKSGTHSMSMMYNNEKAGLFFNGDGSLGTRSATTSYSNEYRISGVENIDKTLENNAGKNWRANASLNYRIIRAKLFDLTINGSFTGIGSPSSGIRRDSTSVGPSETDYVVESSSRSTNYNIGASADWYVGKSGKLALDYRFFSQSEHSRKVRDEKGEGYIQLDSASSYDYYYSYLGHNASVNYEYNSPDGNHTIALSAEGDFSTIGNTNSFPVSYTYGKTFITPVAGVSYSSRKGKSNFSFSYRLSSGLPSTSQLNPIIDDSQPLFVNVGYDALVPSSTNTFSMNRIKVFSLKAPITLYYGASVNLTGNGIVSYKRYFSKQTVLPDYGGYVMSPGSMLYSYRNAGGLVSCDANAGIRTTFHKNSYNIGLRYNHSHNPSYVDEALIFTDRNSYTGTASFLSGWSRQFMQQVMLTAGYSHSVSSLSDYTQMRFGANIFSSNDITDRLFINGSFTASYVRTVGATGIFDNSLKANLGYKLGKKKDFCVSLNFFDILSRSSRYDVRYFDDYMLETFVPNYGRFFTINFAYRFGNIASGGIMSFMAIN
jgi:hypothetical protein